MDFSTVWDMILDYQIATEPELRLVTNINGDTVETLNNIIYSRTGLRNIEQVIEYLPKGRTDLIYK